MVYLISEPTIEAALTVCPVIGKARAARGWPWCAGLARLGRGSRAPAAGASTMRRPALARTVSTHHVARKWIRTTTVDVPKVPDSDKGGLRQIC